MHRRETKSVPNSPCPEHCGDHAKMRIALQLCNQLICEIFLFQQTKSRHDNERGGGFALTFLVIPNAFRSKKCSQVSLFIHYPELSLIFFTSCPDPFNLKGLPSLIFCQKIRARKGEKSETKKSLPR